MKQPQNRTQRLRSLIRQEGSQVAVAAKVGTAPAYLSQITSNQANRNLGDRLARKIESAYGKPTGWMDQPMTEEELSPLANPELAGFVLIPRYDASASLGPGSRAPDNDELIGSLAFKQVWLDKRRLNPQFLAVIDTVGDSMAPTISEGDLLLVDLRQKDPIDNRIFVLRMDDQLYAKRLQVKPDRQITIRSDNPLSPPFEVDLADNRGVEIIGRVVWAGKNL